MANPVEKPYLLHFITPSKNASPFDANMAYDAGYNAVIPYTNVDLADVAGLVQDAIFSRGPRGVWRTGVFIGGRDIILAMDMLEVAKNSMFPPFKVSLFADPSGAFTTSAAMIVRAEEILKKDFNKSIEGVKVKIFGSTGPVGGCTAVLAAKAGADVVMVAHNKVSDVEEKIALYKNKFGVNLRVEDGSTPEKKLQVLSDAEVVICAAKAGVRVLTLDEIKTSTTLKAIVDINAVPPSGAEGVEFNSNGAVIPGTQIRATGALAIGSLKYQVQQDMFKSMINTETTLYLDFDKAYAIAKKIAD